MSERRQLLWAAAVYAALTAIWFFPLLPVFSSALLGPPEDNRLLYWYLWHGVNALPHGPDALMATSYIYYPGGVSLLFASNFYWGIALAAVLKPLFSLVQIYNLLVLHGFLFSALAAFWAAKRWIGTFSGRLVAGFLFAFSLNHFGRSLHHVHLATIYFVPLLIYFLIKSFEGPRRRDRAAAAAFLVLAAMCDWGYFVYGAIATAGGAVYFACKKRDWRVFVTAAWIGISTVLILSPFIVPMMRIDAAQTFRIEYTGHDTYLADLAGFVLPPVYHFFAGNLQAVKDWNLKLSGTEWEKTVYLGWAALVLVAAGWRGWWRHKTLAAGFLLSAVVAMGSHLQVMGNKLPLILPNKLIEITPFLTNARNPARFSVFVFFFFAILAGLAFAHFFPTGKSSLGRKGVAAGVLLLLALDFYPRKLEAVPAVLPPAYDAVRLDAEKDFGVLDVPWEAGRHQFYQTMHGAPIVQGYINRRVENAFVDTLPFDLRRLDTQKALLVDNKVKYVVVHKKKGVWDPSKEADVKYARFMTAVAAAYGRTYEKIFEDDAAATFKVY